MAIKVGELLFQMSADTAAVKRGMNEVRGEFSKTAAHIKSSMSAVATTLAGLGIGAFVRSSLQAAEALHNISQRTGIAVETLSAMEDSAHRAELTTETLAIHLALLSKNAFEATTGNKELAKIFSALGIGLKDSSGQLRPMESLLGDIAEKFKGLHDGTTKSALAMKLFGRSGAEMIPFLNQGRAGIQGIARITTEAAQAADQFSDNLEGLKLSLQGTFVEGAAKSVGAINRLVEMFSAWRTDLEVSTGLIFDLGKGLAQMGAINEGIRKFASQSPAEVLFGKGKGLGKLIDAELADLENFFQGWEKTHGAITRTGTSVGDLANAFDEPIKKAKQLFEIWNKNEFLFRDFTGKAPTLFRPGEKGEPDLLATVGAELPGTLDPKLWDELQAARHRVWVETRNAVELYAIEKDRLEALGLDQETFAKALDLTAKNLGLVNEQGTTNIGMMDRLKDSAQEFRSAIGQAFEDAIINGRSLREVLQGLLQDIARLILRSLVIEPLFGPGGMISGLFGRQHGGPVWPGQAFMVGEAGPEVFVPQVPGNIVPAGRGVGTNISITVDARGAQGGAEHVIEAAIVRGIQAARKAAVLDMHSLSIRHA